jgi:soluble lytic murein transglycosylase
VPLALVLNLGAMAQTLEPIARSFRDKPSPVTRAALEQFLMKHPKDAEGALARLLLFNGDTTSASIEKLRAARPSLPEIGDYVDWMVGSTEFAAKDFPAALLEVEKVLRVADSPLVGRAALIGIKSAVEMGELTKVEAMLARHAKQLTGAQVAHYSGVVAQKRDQTEAARKQFVRVLTQWPRSPEAAESLKYLPLADLKPVERLERANQLLEQGDAGGARAEFVAILPRLDGAAADQARVRIGVCDYRLRKPTALASLTEVKVSDANADAERLFYAVMSARRAKAYDSMGVAMRELSEKHPKSSFRLEGLANAASQYWVMGDHTKSLPLYEACAVDFAAKPEGKDCDWKVAVQHYILQKPGAEKKLEAHLRSDPGGEHASAALYFLGKSAEGRRDRAAAKSYYQRAIESFPNHFYAELSRDRIVQGGLQGQNSSPTVEAMLKELRFPLDSLHLNFEANAATKRRMARAELLARGALYDYAELELRFEARGTEQSHLLAMAAARIANRRGAPDQGIRYMKSIFPAYLNLPINAATLPLWKLAYPMPYKDPLLTYSFKNELDPYLLAGLIRQESEFSAKVLSRANAHGLTQIMPATGRELARRLGIKGFTTKMLLEPTVNLQMGSYYLRSLINSLGGSLEQALASYNAGKGRVTQWLERGEYRDPAEFVESIPFNETRGYVQSVMRNAGIYRRLYGNDAAILPAPGLPSGNGDSSAAQRSPAKQ